jgi:hypothetical protein
LNAEERAAECEAPGGSEGLQQIDAAFSESFVDCLFAAGAVLVEGDTDKVVIEIEAEDRKNRTLNRAIMEYHGVPNLTDYPVGRQNAHLVVWGDNLEQVLQDRWPAWIPTYEGLLAELGEGKTKRAAAVYRLTARRCEGPPSEVLTEVITMARGLSGL